jgi:hypothetical protein
MRTVTADAATALVTPARSETQNSDTKDRCSKPHPTSFLIFDYPCCARLQYTLESKTGQSKGMRDARFDGFSAAVCESAGMHFKYELVQCKFMDGFNLKLSTTPNINLILTVEGVSDQL